MYIQWHLRPKGLHGKVSGPFPLQLNMQSESKSYMTSFLTHRATTLALLLLSSVLGAFVAMIVQLGVKKDILTLRHRSRGPPAYCKFRGFCPKNQNKLEARHLGKMRPKKSGQLPRGSRNLLTLDIQ